MAKKTTMVDTMAGVFDGLKTVPALGAQGAAKAIDDMASKLGGSKALLGRLYILTVAAACKAIEDGYSGSVAHFKIAQLMPLLTDVNPENQSAFDLMLQLQSHGAVRNFRFKKGNKNGWFLTALDSNERPTKDTGIDSEITDFLKDWK